MSGHAAASAGGRRCLQGSPAGAPRRGVAPCGSAGRARRGLVCVRRSALCGSVLYMAWWELERRGGVFGARQKGRG